MSLTDAVVGLKAYKEVDERMLQLWHDLDKAILSRRTDITSEALPALRVNDVRCPDVTHASAISLTRR